MIMKFVETWCPRVLRALSDASQKCSGRANTLPNASPTSNLAGRVEEAGRDAVRSRRRQVTRHAKTTVFSSYLHVPQCSRPVTSRRATPMSAREAGVNLLRTCRSYRRVAAHRTGGRQRAVPISAVSSHDEKLLCYLMMHTIHANCLVCDCVQYSLARTYSARWTDAKSRPATKVDQPRRGTSPLVSV